jgi:hypothetical protein
MRTAARWESWLVVQLSIYRKLTAGSVNRRLRWHRLHGLSSEVKASIDGGVIIRKSFKARTAIPVFLTQRSNQREKRAAAAVAG